MKKLSILIVKTCKVLMSTAGIFIFNALFFLAPVIIGFENSYEWLKLATLMILLFPVIHYLIINFIMKKNIITVRKEIDNFLEKVN